MQVKPRPNHRLQWTTTRPATPPRQALDISTRRAKMQAHLESGRESGRAGLPRRLMGYARDKAPG